MHKVYRTNPFFALFIGFLIVCAIYGIPTFLARSGNSWQIAIAVFGVFIWSIGLVVALRQKFVVSDDGIEWLQLKRIFVKWQDITKITHNYMWLTGDTFRIYLLRKDMVEIIGINSVTSHYKDLMREVLKRVPDSAQINPKIYDVLEPKRFFRFQTLKNILSMFCVSFAVLSILASMTFYQVITAPSLVAAGAFSLLSVWLYIKR